MWLAGVTLGLIAWRLGSRSNVATVRWSLHLLGYLRYVFVRGVSLESSQQSRLRSQSSLIVVLDVCNDRNRPNASL
eukprot:scaffold110768_cov63-Attheya_sp.AAC.2